MQFRVEGSKEAHLFILQTPLAIVAGISLNMNTTNEEKGTDSFYFCHYSPFFWFFRFLSVDVHDMMNE